MEKPKFEIGDKFYLAILRHTFASDRIIDYEPRIKGYVINAVRYEKHKYCDDMYGRIPTPQRSKEIITYSLSDGNWIGVVAEITESQLLKLYGRTPEEAQQKALRIIQNIDLPPNPSKDE